MRVKAQQSCSKTIDVHFNPNDASVVDLGGASGHAPPGGHINFMFREYPAAGSTTVPLQFKLLQSSSNI